MAVFVTDGEIKCGDSLESLSINRQSVFKNPQNNKTEQAPMTKQRPTKKREFGIMFDGRLVRRTDSIGKQCDLL